MEQPTNDLCQAQTKLETAERELEAAERELEAAERKLEAAEIKREAQAFSSDEWKFYNEEVTACRVMVKSNNAMVVSDIAIVLKLTPAPGTYSPPPPPHTRITHNPTHSSSTPPFHPLLCQQPFTSFVLSLELPISYPTPLIERTRPRAYCAPFG